MKDYGFSLHGTQYIPRIGEAIIIVTGTQTAHLHYAECFLFVYKDGDVLYRFAERINHSMHSNKSDEIVEFLISSQLNKAAAELDNFIYSHIGELSNTSQPHPVIEPIQELALFHFYYRMENDRRTIRYLLDHSKSEKLQHYVKILDRMLSDSEIHREEIEGK